MKATHSKYFWNKKYKEIKRFAKDRGIFFPYKSKREFISDWEALRVEGVKDITKEIKYSLQYETSYKTALAEKKALQSLDIEVPKFAELKKMSTQEFASRYSTRIEDNYRELKASGMTGTEAAAFISNYWFGSL